MSSLRNLTERKLDLALSFLRTMLLLKMLKLLFINKKLNPDTLSASMIKMSL